MYLAVNASPQLVLSNTLERVIEAVPRAVVVELTEHSEIEDYGALRAALLPIWDRVRLAVDDVGAGYSGLRHILDLGPDILKLDMSLTRDVDSDPARRALIGAMVDFAAGIGCSMVAEGVETDAEREVLHDLGVDHAGMALQPGAAAERAGLFAAASARGTGERCAAERPPFFRHDPSISRACHCAPGETFIAARRGRSWSATCRRRGDARWTVQTMTTRCQRSARHDLTRSPARTAPMREEGGEDLIVSCPTWKEKSTAALGS
jgi:hypothetical protein